MQISQNTNFYNYSNNLHKQNFGNQTTRGVTLKAIGALEEALEDDFMSSANGAFTNRLRSTGKRYSDISKTRWEAGNDRYFGKDKKKW